LASFGTATELLRILNAGRNIDFTSGALAILLLLLVTPPPLLLLPRLLLFSLLIPLLLLLSFSVPSLAGVAVG
jgi:hypothetical protein